MAIDLLPIEVRFQGDINVDNTVNNSALWHKSCHLKFNWQEKESEINPIKMMINHLCKQLSTITITTIIQCLLCLKDTDDGDLHQV